MNTSITYIKIPNVKTTRMLLALPVLIASTIVFSSPSYARSDANLERCFSAVFGSKQIKRIKIYGHHFNCKPIKKSGNWYSGRLSHNVKWDFDEQFDYKFKLNRDGSVDLNSFSVKIKFQKHAKWIRKGIDFVAKKAIDYTSLNIASGAQISAVVSDARTRIRGNWKGAGNTIIAQIMQRTYLDKKRNRTLSCSTPTLWEYPNYRGRTMRAPRPDRNIHKSKNFGDKASSICVPKGWIVRFYEHPNLKGKSFRLDGPRKVVNLWNTKVKGKRMDNRISSFNVVRK